MTFKVNGQLLDITLENEKTVGEVLKAFEIELEKNNGATLNIIIDGKEISADEFDEAIKQELKEDTSIELSVVFCSEIKQSLNTSLKEFNELGKQLEEISVLLQTGKDKEVNVIITKLASEVEKFCKTASLSALFPEVYENLKIDGKSVGDFFEDFSPILSDFEQSLSTKDTVTIGDLAEYEISPRLFKISEAIEKLN